MSTVDPQSCSMSSTPRSSSERDCITGSPSLTSQSHIPHRSSSVPNKSTTSTTVLPMVAVDLLARQTMDASDIEKHFINPHSELVTRVRPPNQAHEPRPIPEPALASSSSTSRPPRHIIVAPNDPSPLNPRYHTTNIDSKSTNDHTPTPTEPSHNVHHEPETTSLPLGSNLENPRGILNSANITPSSKPGTIHTTHHTDVDEVFHPAVTHETIHSHRVDVIQEEITRDIHIHHYYTYIQPITVTEILPARHFLINPQTGAKTEIPTPQGWVMPKDMQPAPSDMRHLAPISRHYLVDEEHPLGVDEPAPDDMKSSSASFLESIAYQSHQDVWST